MILKSIGTLLMLLVLQPLLHSEAGSGKAEDWGFEPVNGTVGLVCQMIRYLVEYGDD